MPSLGYVMLGYVMLVKVRESKAEKREVYEISLGAFLSILVTSTPISLYLQYFINEWN